MKKRLYLLLSVCAVAMSHGVIASQLCSTSLLDQSLDVATSAEPQVVYSLMAEDQASRPQLFARLQQDDNEPHGKAKGHDKNKAKGKAKGHDKDSENTGDQTTTTDSAPANAATQPGQPPAVKPAPAQPGSSSAPAAASHTTTPKSPAEIKTETDQRLRQISNLDKNTATSKARFAALSKETGVPVATLETQHKANPVGSGGLLIANEMAKATGKPASTFMKERLQGKDWHKIAAENKFDLTPVLPKLERLQQTMEGAVKK